MSLVEEQFMQFRKCPKLNKDVIITRITPLPPLHDFMILNLVEMEIKNEIPITKPDNESEITKKVRKQIELRPNIRSFNCDSSISCGIDITECPFNNNSLSI